MNETEKVKTYLAPFKCLIACLLKFILLEMPIHLPFSCRLSGSSLIFFFSEIIHSNTLYIAQYIYVFIKVKRWFLPSNSKQSGEWTQSCKNMYWPQFLVTFY